MKLLKIGQNNRKILSCPSPLWRHTGLPFFSADINVKYRVIPLKLQTTRKNAQLNIEAIQTLLSLILQALRYTSSGTGKL